MINITQDKNKIIIKYIGGLTYSSEKIFFIYQNSTAEYKEVEMEKQDDEYILELDGINGDVYYYFKNEKGEIDNNFDMNYYYEIKNESESNIIVVEKKEIDVKRKKLRKLYILSKKIKIAIYKLMISLPRFITGNYRRRINL